MTEKTDVLQGTLALMALKTLDVLGPLHGYGIRPGQGRRATCNTPHSKNVMRSNRGGLMHMHVP
jgi:hypothetical protein